MRLRVAGRWHPTVEGRAQPRRRKQAPLFEMPSKSPPKFLLRAKNKNVNMSLRSDRFILVAGEVRNRGDSSVSHGASLCDELQPGYELQVCCIDPITRNPDVQRNSQE